MPDAMIRGGRNAGKVALQVAPRLALKPEPAADLIIPRTLLFAEKEFFQVSAEIIF